MTNSLIRVAAVVLGLVAGAGSAVADAASTSKSALVRVEVVDADGGARMRKSVAVAWSQTATLELQAGGHAHALSITPSEHGAGVAFALDHARDGETLADDLAVTGATRRVVIEQADATIIVTVIPVRSHIDAS